MTARLGGTAPVGGPVQPGVEVFLGAARAASGALAGELHWLGDTVTAVAASWLALHPAGRWTPASGCSSRAWAWSPWTPARG